ncbi:hypothetical protein [Thalassospira sp. MCCC 1A01148]|nr:hypothetical protein [Thalassospira sp. MCCC 1A01148]MBR9901846.1 hypothetical protein [Rhodospirillales bacterium]
MGHGVRSGLFAAFRAGDSMVGRNLREHLIGIIAQGNPIRPQLSGFGPLAGHKSETYIWFRAKILRNGISVIFLQKGV